MEESSEDIETLIEDLEFIPGHFHLLLNLNIESSRPADRRLHDAQMKRENLQTELEAETGSFQYAIRNMLGLLAYHSDDLEEAEEAFRSICREDSGNLNAWANLAQVCGRLGRDSQESECLEQVKSLMELETSESLAEGRLRAARCLAEQAFAHIHDVELQREEDLQERMSTALALFSRALRYAAELLPREETWGWYFKMATIHIKLYDIANELEHARLTHYNKALTLLTETLKSDTTNLKALAWCYVGLLLEKRDEFSTVPMSVHDCGLSGSEPLSCYGSGIKLATDDAFTLNQLASVFFWSGKHEMSMGICNMALNVLPDAELNWKAYCTRAKIKLTSYIKALDQAKLGLSGIPDRQDLMEARADLEQVQSVQPCLRTHLEMGQVHYYMGVDAVKESLMVDEMAVNQALVSLAQALKCPLGSSLPELHLLRGRCLLLKGEEENAIDCFRQAMELERAGSPQQQALHFLLEALLTSFAKSTGDIGHILAQAEECVQLAEDRHGTDAVRAELRVLCRTYTDEVTELSRELVKKGKLGMVRRLLQSIQPQDKLPLCRSLSV